MIALHNSETGGVQFVETLGGVDLEAWAVVADPAPSDATSEPYMVVEGVLVPDLATARARQRAIINAARDAAQDGGAVTPSGAFDSAPRSRDFLNGAVTNAFMATVGEQPFSIDWTLANNSVVTLDAAALIAAGQAVAAWVDTVHQRAIVLKGRIDAAETLEAIAAVIWTLEDEV